MPQHVLIAIHGVGAPMPGEVVDELLSVPHTAVDLPLYERVDLASAGRTIPCAQSTAPAAFDTLVELNWSDVGRLNRGPIGVVRHLFLLVLAMLNVQPGRPGRTDAQVWPERAYRQCFEALFVWCIWPVVTTLLVHEAATPFLKVMTAVSATAIVAALTSWFTAYSPTLRAGYVWALLCLVVGLLQAAMGTDRDAAVIVVAAQMYAFGQFATVLLLGLLGGHVVLAGWREGRTRDQIASRIALGHAPLMMIAIAGAVIWAAALSVTSSEAQKTWTPSFLLGLRYNLRLVEQSATLIIAIVTPMSVLAAAGAYLLQRRHGGAGGAVVRSWLSSLLLIIPLLLSFPGAMLVYGFVVGIASPGEPDDVVAVYAASALRVVPWMGMALVPPLRIFFDVLGDVAFFVVPLDSRISVRSETTARLRKLLDQFRGSPVTVLAYSQGSVIALEELRKDDNVTLITVGAPIHSLYKRFLGFELSVASADRTWRWLNLWRRGDYVGGPIDAADDDSPLKRDGGHLGYFSDAEVWEVLTRVTPLSMPPKTLTGADRISGGR